MTDEITEPTAPASRPSGDRCSTWSRDRDRRCQSGHVDRTGPWNRAPGAASIPVAAEAESTVTAVADREPSLWKLAG